MGCSTPRSQSQNEEGYDSFVATASRVPCRSGTGHRAGIDLALTRRCGGHIADPGDGPEPAHRGPTCELVRLGAARSTRPPERPRTLGAGAGTDVHRAGPRARCARRHRVRAVDARKRVVVVPQQRADPWQLQQLRGLVRVQQPAHRHDVCRREEVRTDVAVALLRNARGRSRRADHVVARLRGPQHEGEEPQPPTARRPHRHRADLGAVRWSERHGDLGHRERLRHPRVERVLRRAREERCARRVPPVLARRRRPGLGTGLLGRHCERLGVLVRYRRLPRRYGRPPRQRADHRF